MHKSGAVMSTELEASIEKKRESVFERLQLFFQPFCTEERKIIFQYNGSIPYLLSSY